MTAPADERSAPMLEVHMQGKSFLYVDRVDDQGAQYGLRSGAIEGAGSGELLFLKVKAHYTGAQEVRLDLESAQALAEGLNNWINWRVAKTGRSGIL